MVSVFKVASEPLPQRASYIQSLYKSLLWDTLSKALKYTTSVGILYGWVKYEELAEAWAMFEEAKLVYIELVSNYIIFHNFCFDVIL